MTNYTQTSPGVQLLYFTTRCRYRFPCEQTHIWRDSFCNFQNSIPKHTRSSATSIQSAWESNTQSNPHFHPSANSKNPCSPSLPQRKCNTWHWAKQQLKVSKYCFCEHADWTIPGIAVRIPFFLNITWPRTGICTPPPGTISTGFLPFARVFFHRFHRCRCWNYCTFHRRLLWIQITQKRGYQGDIKPSSGSSASRQTAHRIPWSQFPGTVHGNLLGVFEFPFQMTSLALFKQPYGKLLLFWQQLFQDTPSTLAANSHSLAVEMKSSSAQGSSVVSYATHWATTKDHTATYVRNCR